MARETKIVKVKPDKEKTTIYGYQSFGWELMSTQEILVSDNNSLYVDEFTADYHPTLNYVKLVFTRDTSMPNYSKLRDLEKQLFKTRAPIRTDSHKGMSFRLFICPLITIISTILFFVSCFTFPLTVAIIVCIMCVCLFVSSIVLNIQGRRWSKIDDKAYDDKKYEHQQLLEKIIQEARKLSGF